jgi:hypothetical protein
VADGYKVVGAVMVGSGWSHQDKKTSRVVWCGEEAVGLWERSCRATWGK